MKLTTVYEVLKDNILAYILVYEDGTYETKKPKELMDALLSGVSKYPAFYLKATANGGKVVGVDETKVELIKKMRWEVAIKHISDRAAGQESKQSNAQQSSYGELAEHEYVGVRPKTKNYRIQLPDGSYTNLTEGTRLTKIQVIAGKGRDRRIDEIDILLDVYGGSEFEWMKKKGIGGYEKFPVG